MNALLSAVFLALASTTLASPMPAPRQTGPGPWCDGFGGGAFDVAYNFTLAAVYRDLPNANDTGVPIVLGQAGAVDGASFEVLSTYATYPYLDYPTLSLEHGALFGNAADGDFQAIGYNITSGEEVGFVTTGLDPPTPAQIYCAIADTDPEGGGSGLPWLAVNNDADSFSLCLLGGTQNNIVYKATAANPDGYDFSTCQAVTLQIIEPY